MVGEAAEELGGEVRPARGRGRVGDFSFLFNVLDFLFDLTGGSQSTSANLDTLALTGGSHLSVFVSIQD
jgi:hypothetical protein